MKSVAAFVVPCCCVAVAVLHEAEAFVSPTRSFGKLDSRSHLASNGHAVCSAGSAFSPVPRGASMRSMQRAGIVKRCRGGVQRHVLKAQMTDEEMALDQALIARVAQEVEAESGVDLEQLINPGKVINLERDLVKLRASLEEGGGADRASVEEEIAKKESTLAIEKRTYMKGWLKKIFVGQAVLTTVLGGLMAYDAVPGFPNVDLSVRVLGFWFVWLFTVPSLRARKPGEAEKVALNIAFLATPVISFAMPFITKDPVPIYWANIATVAACYGYGFTIGKPDGGDAGGDKNQPKWLKFIYKSLDFGSGQERGVRGEARDRLLGGDEEEQESAVGSTATTTEER